MKFSVFATFVAAMVGTALAGHPSPSNHSNDQNCDCGGKTARRWLAPRSQWSADCCDQTEPLEKRDTEAEAEASVDFDEESF